MEVNNIRWNNTLDSIKRYIDINQTLPNYRDKDINIKHLGSWLTYQRISYNKYKKKYIV